MKPREHLTDPTADIVLQPRNRPSRQLGDPGEEDDGRRVEEGTPRSICSNETEPDEPRGRYHSEYLDFAACVRCNSWQHKICMGYTDLGFDYVYFCDRCEPSWHVETLAKLARGEKIWEVRYERSEAGRECVRREALEKEVLARSPGEVVAELSYPAAHPRVDTIENGSETLPSRSVVSTLDGVKIVVTKLPYDKLVELRDYADAEDDKQVLVRFVMQKVREVSLLSTVTKDERACLTAAFPSLIDETG